MTDVLKIISKDMFNMKDFIIPDNIKIVHQLDEAEFFCFQQWGIDTVWLDLRENKSLNLEFASKEDREYWAEYISDKLEQYFSDSIYSEFINDIDDDLFNCYINQKLGSNDDFWNMIFDTYKMGMLPCGWDGEFPDGNLVVFIPS